MKINSKDFRVRFGEKVTLKECPTIVQPICTSKKLHQKLQEEHVEELSSPQHLYYAPRRYLKTDAKRRRELKLIHKQVWR